MKIKLTISEKEKLLFYLEEYRLKYAANWLNEIPANRKDLLRLFYVHNATDSFSEIAQELGLTPNYEEYLKQVETLLVNDTARVSQMTENFRNFLVYKTIFG